MTVRSGGPYGRIVRGLDDAPIAPKQRPCLRCRKPFDSAGPGNRVCAACSNRAGEMSPYAL